MEQGQGGKRKASEAGDSIMVESVRKREGNFNQIRYSPRQVEAIRSGLSKGLTLINGAIGSGKTTVAAQIVSNLYHSEPQGRILVITQSKNGLNQLFEKIQKHDIDARHLLRLEQQEDQYAVVNQWDQRGRVNSYLETRLRLLKDVDRLSKSLDVYGAHAENCSNAGYFYKNHVETRWNAFLLKIEQESTVENIKEAFPFGKYSKEWITGSTVKQLKQNALDAYSKIQELFKELEVIRPFEILRSDRDREAYFIVKEARIVVMTSHYAAIHRRDLVRLGFKFSSVIVEEASQMLEIETFIPLVLQSYSLKSDFSALKRLVLLGDDKQLPCSIKTTTLETFSNLEQSMFSRLLRLGVPSVTLDVQGGLRPSLGQLVQWAHPEWTPVGDDERFKLANAGFAFEYQWINVPDYKQVGESFPRRGFYQNLGEAEYVVAVYQYMRLLG